MKMIAYYLPQYHPIPENDELWGEGFTEWVNVRKAKQLYEGHNQPRVPLNSNYYNLLDVETLRWQVKLAKKYHIWGFCFYHYWFGEKMLLQRPMEILLENKNIHMPFCVSWANESWTNQWVSNSPKIWIKQEYGDRQEWKNHFDYLLPFFRDSRYIKINDCPVVVIYKPLNFERINEWIDFWNSQAKKAGFPSICFMSQMSDGAYEKEKFFRKIDYYLDYQPVNTFIQCSKEKRIFFRQIKHIIKKLAIRCGADIEGKKIYALTNGVRRWKYDNIWESLLSKEPCSEKDVPGCFVDWDNTPRKGKRGSVLTGASPLKFKKYYELQVKRCKDVYKKDFMFIFAWNEWAEGGYLEPDEKYGYAYLEAIKDVLEELNEVEDS